MKKIMALLIGFLLTTCLCNSSLADINELHYNMLVHRYAELVEGDGSYLGFFGDSLTDSCLWEDVWEGITAVNLGVSGDTLECLCLRMPVLEAAGVCKAFVMGGINDLCWGYDFPTIEEHAEKLFELLNGLDASVYIQSILPIRPGAEAKVGKATNEQILQLNELLKELCGRYDFTYIDLHPFFCDENGVLKAEFTGDGLHINLDGYQCWWSAIESYITE